MSVNYFHMFDLMGIHQKLYSESHSWPLSASPLFANPVTSDLFDFLHLDFVK